jgi:hypothetical protein
MLFWWEGWFGNRCEHNLLTFDPLECSNNEELRENGRTLNIVFYTAIIQMLNKLGTVKITFLCHHDLNLFNLKEAYNKFKYLILFCKLEKCCRNIHTSTFLHIYPSVASLILIAVEIFKPRYTKTYQSLLGSEYAITRPLKLLVWHSKVSCLIQPSPLILKIEIIQFN